MNNPKQEAKYKIQALWEVNRLKSLAEIDFQREVLWPEMEKRKANFQKEIDEAKSEIAGLAESHKYEDRQRRKELEEKLGMAQNNLLKQENEKRKSETIIGQCEEKAREAEKYLEILSRY